MRCGNSSLIRSCPRNCEREVSSRIATGGIARLREGGRGADPRARRPAVVRVEATNIGRGTPVDDPKDAEPFGKVSFGPRSRRRQALRGRRVLTLLRQTV